MVLRNILWGIVAVLLIASAIYMAFRDRRKRSRKNQHDKSERERETEIQIQIEKEKTRRQPPWWGGGQ